MSDVDVSFGADTSELKDKLKELGGNMSEAMNKGGESTSLMSAALDGLKAAAIAASVALLSVKTFTALVDATKQAASYGDEIDKASQRTGMAADKFQELQFAARMSDISTQALEGGMRKLTKAMESAAGGGAAQADAFSRVGLKADELKGMKIEDVMGRVSDAFAKSNDGTAKAALAMTLFGRSGADMIPFLNKGSDSIAELSAQAHNLGLIMSDDAIAVAGALDDELKLMGINSEGTSRIIGTALMPAMLNLTKLWNQMSGDGSILTAVFEGIGWVIDTVTWALSYVIEDFIILSKVAVGTATALTAVAHGDLKGAGEIISQMGDDVVETTRKFEKFRDELENPPKAKKGEKKEDLPAADTGSEDMKKWQAELEAMRAKDVADNGVLHTLKKEQEHSFWRDKLDLTKAGGEAHKQVIHLINAAARGSAKEELTEFSAASREKIAVAKGNSVQQLLIMQEELARKKQYYGSDQAEYKNALREMAAFLRQQSEHRKSLAEAELEHKNNLGKISLSDGLADQRFLNDVYQDGANDRARIDRAGLEEEYKNAREYMLLKKDIAGMTTEEKQKIDNQIEALDKTHNAKMMANSRDIGRAVAAEWMKWGNIVGSSFENSIVGMVKGTMTLKQAITNMSEAILREFLHMGVQMLVRTLAGNAGRAASEMATDATITSSHIAANTAMASSDALKNTTAGVGAGVASGTVIGAKVTEATAVVTANATEIGTGNAAAVAPIPIVGPAMSIAAFGAGIALGLGALGMIKSSAGGEWQVGEDRLNIVHKDETILPAGIAGKLRNMVEGGGGSQAGTGNTTVQNISNNFKMSQNVDRRTQTQIAQNASKSMNVAARRNG